MVILYWINLISIMLYTIDCSERAAIIIKEITSRWALSPWTLNGTNPKQDLSQVGRDLRETIIIDNSPTSYIFHPQHAVPISSWFSDAHDNELLDLIPVLEDLAGPQVRDVSLVLDVGLWCGIISNHFGIHISGINNDGVTFDSSRY